MNFTYVTVFNNKRPNVLKFSNLKIFFKNQHIYFAYIYIVLFLAVIILLLPLI
jgi:hypothetical protein